MRLLASRPGEVVVLLLVVACLDSLLLKFTRSWADLLPVGLAGLFAVLLAIRAAGRHEPVSRRGRLAGWLASLDGYGLAGLLGFLALVLLFHVGFERAGGDGRDYFAQLHSIVMDRDLDFANEIREFGVGAPEIYPIGSALLWLPFYLAAHLWLLLLSLAGTGVSPDGYGPPYQMAIGLGTLVYGFLGLALIYRVAAGYFPRGIAFAATTAVCAGSFILWYLTLDNAYAHGNSMFAVTLFLVQWHRTRGGRRTTKGWVWLGACAALMTRTLGSVAASAAVFFAAVSPQLYFWKVTNGGWFAVPHGQAGQMWWSDPLLLDVLFSSNHGLVAWHPLLYVAALGMPLFMRRDWRFGSLLAVLFLAQVYLNGAVSTWWGGSAFGGRRFDGSALFFVLGFAAVIQAGLRRPAVVLGGIVSVFVAANALLMTDIYRGTLPIGEGLPANRFMDSAYRRIGNPFSFPANAIFAWQHGGTAEDYDQMGRQLFSNVHIDLGEAADEFFLMHGWSGAESDDYGSFRWSDGPVSRLSVPLLGARVVPEGEPARMGDYVLRFRAEPFEAPGFTGQAIEIEVNGVVLAEPVLGSGWHDVIAVPGAHLGRGLNRFSFRYRYALSPEQAGTGADPRVLAVRFDAIHLEQVTGG